MVIVVVDEDTDKVSVTVLSKPIKKNKNNKLKIPNNGIFHKLISKNIM